MATTYLDPTAEEGVPVEPYELFADISSALRVGLVANTFPDGTRFMDKLEAALTAAMPAFRVLRFQKPGLAPVDDEQLAAIRSGCDAVIAAWGH